MPHPASAQLRFGPYPVPRFRYGRKVTDEARGDVQIVGISDARIPWPVGLKRSSRSVVLCGSLVNAVRRESATAIRYWWGVSAWMIKKWRSALGVEYKNAGT